MGRIDALVLNLSVQIRGGVARIDILLDNSTHDLVPILRRQVIDLI